MAGKFKRFMDRFLGRPANEATSSYEDQIDGEDTFVSATGGGWSDLPEVVQADGGSQRDYVSMQLERAQQQAVEKGLQSGDVLKYRLVNIPQGIVSPHEIAFGMMIKASAYGFTPGVMRDEIIDLTLN